MGRLAIAGYTTPLMLSRSRGCRGGIAAGSGVRAFEAESRPCAEGALASSRSRRWARIGALWLAWSCSPALPELSGSAGNEPGRAQVDAQGNGGEAGSAPSAPKAGEKPSVGGLPSEPAWGSVPALRSPVELRDNELGRSALDLMAGGGPEGPGRCAGCHSLGQATLSRWAAQTRAFSAACLQATRFETQTQLDQLYDCLQQRAREVAGLPASGGEAAPASPRALGVYAAGVHLPWFEFLVQNASGNREREAAHAAFVREVGMPRGEEPLEQSQFDLLVDWFERGTPGLAELVPIESAEDCTPSLSAGLATALEELAQTGWRAKNRETPLLMLGCSPGQEGRECLGGLPDAAATALGSDWARALPGSTLRILHDNSDRPRTSFWTRSSADGRYVGSGLSSPANGLSGQFVDLSNGRRIPGEFLYDPVFFPDNSGFMVQSSGEFGGLVCAQSTLQGNRVESDNAGCSTVGAEIGLYQQVATALGGDDYWAVHGPYQADEPGRRQLENPPADFGASATLQFTPLLNLGNGFSPGSSLAVSTPFQGDASLSPSGRLLVTRVQGRDEWVDGSEFGPKLVSTQSGYALHLVDAASQGESLSVRLEEAGRLCLAGGKAVFSFDERWLVTYRYVTREDAAELGYQGPDDSAFAGYLEQGASNLYLLDLTTGRQRRITHMAPGQYALFPHFRSDGWLYFVMRTAAGQELFVAHDGALLLEEAER